MSLLRPEITDDRAKPVRLVHQRHFGLFADGPAEKRARLKSASAAMERDCHRTGIRANHGWGLVCTILLVVAFNFSLIYVLDVAGVLYWAPYVCGPIAGALSGFLWHVIKRLLSRRYLARKHVLAGYCASCGYDLRGTIEESDGCRVCPECGAAWRVPGDAAVAGNAIPNVPVAQSVT